MYYVTPNPSSGAARQKPNVFNTRQLRAPTVRSRAKLANFTRWQNTSRGEESNGRPPLPVPTQVPRESKPSVWGRWSKYSQHPTH